MRDIIRSLGYTTNALFFKCGFPIEMKILIGGYLLKSRHINRFIQKFQKKYTHIYSGPYNLNQTHYLSLQVIDHILDYRDSKTSVTKGYNLVSSTCKTDSLRSYKCQNVILRCFYAVFNKILIVSMDN